MSGGTIEFGSRQIPYAVEPGRGKRLRIIVTPGLRVRVRVPAAASGEAVHAVLQKKAPWIARQLDRQERFHPLPTPKRYVSGETFVYLGRQYRLKVAEGKRHSARLKGRFLEVAVPVPDHREAVRRAVERWYFERARETFDRYGARCLAIGERHGIRAAQFHIRKMRSRWGACSTRDRITLNLLLVQTPVHCIEYVLMHELCHLVHHNHSIGFYRLLTRCMPDWEKRRQVLDSVAVVPAMRGEAGL